AGRAGPAAVLPLARPAVVDAEGDVPVAPLPVVASRAGVQRQREAAARGRVVLADDIAQHSGDRALGMDPGRDAEVAASDVERRAGGNFQEAASSVEPPGCEVHAAVDGVVSAPGM